MMAGHPVHQPAYEPGPGSGVRACGRQQKVRGRLGGKAVLAPAISGLCQLVWDGVCPGQLGFALMVARWLFMVRRRSTVRFRKGAPGQGLVSNAEPKTFFCGGNPGGSFVVYRGLDSSPGEGLRLGSSGLRRSGYGWVLLCVLAGTVRGKEAGRRPLCRRSVPR
jgi:hypothetical protein